MAADTIAPVADEALRSLYHDITQAAPSDLSYGEYSLFIAPDGESRQAHPSHMVAAVLILNKWRPEAYPKDDKDFWNLYDVIVQATIDLQLLLQLVRVTWFASTRGVSIGIEIYHPLTAPQFRALKDLLEWRENIDAFIAYTP